MPNFIKMSFLAVTLAPIRVVAAAALIVASNAASMIGLVGVSDEDLESKPLVGWRRGLQGFVLLLCRGIFFCFGVHRVHVIGRQVSQV